MNPIKYQDLFDLNDGGELKKITRNIRDLKEVYTEFFNSIVTGGLQALNTQQNECAKTARELAKATKELNITQKDQQQQIIENARAIAQLEAENKKLKATSDALKTTNSSVKTEVDSLTRRLREQTAEYKKLYTAEVQDKQALDALALSINKTRADIALMNNALKVNVQQFNAAKGSYNALDAETKKLVADLKQLPDAFGKNKMAAEAMQKQIFKNTQQLKDFDAAMNNNTRNVGNYASAFGQIKGQLLSMVGPLALFSAGIAAVGKIISNNAEISDSLADVQRTAQLTEKEVDNLLTTLKSFNTRTSLKGLLDIAIIAGQLGIAKEDIAGFVKSIDQLAVVLAGEIPGGAEAVATALGKINGVFKTQINEGTNIEEAYNKTGSAILKLGQEGLATGAYLQDFTLRVSGSAQQAKIALPTILAYGAVLEETGASAEIGATALNKLLGSLSSKRDKFFAIAKLGDASLTLKKFTDLINNDANKALTLFFEGLNKGGSKMTQFSDLLDSIQLKSGPYKNAIVNLAQNQDLLTQRIEAGTKAYNDGSLATEQFKIKNDNLAGSLEKLSNKFDKLSSDPNSGIGKFFKYVVDAASDALDEVDKVLRRVELIALAIKGGFKVNGTPVGARQAVAAAQAQRAESDRINSSAGTKATSLVNASKNDIDLLKKIANEEYKLSQIQGKVKENNKELVRRKEIITLLGEKEKYYSSSKDKDRDDASKNYTEANKQAQKTTVQLKEQKALVDALKKSYEKLYPKKVAVDNSDPDAFKKVGAEKKGPKGKTAAQIEKENREQLDRLFQAQAKYEVSLTELAFTEGEQTVEDQIRFEKDKLGIQEKFFEYRLNIYKKDSVEYINILEEKNKAEISAEEKIIKIKKEAQERELKRLEEIAKAKAGYEKAVGEKDQTTFETGVGKRVSKGEITQGTANTLLFDDRQNRFNLELKAQQEALKKMKEGDADYYNKKKEIVDLEKAMIEDRYNYEISQAEIAAEKRKQLEQDIFDYTSEIGNALFDISASFSQAKQEDIQHAYEKDTEAAGNNAQAKKKIEEEYQKKMLAMKRKQAIFDKAQALFNIGIQTALAVSAALAPPPLGLGPIFGIPFATKAAILGAVQAAVVLAKPLPKYKDGREGGPGTYAIVNDGNGPELLEKNGKFRIAGGGKETVTYLQDGEKVHTAERSLSMLSDKHDSNKFIDSLLIGTQVVRQHEYQNQRMLADALINSKMDPNALKEAFGDAIEEMPFTQNNIDEKGFTTYLVRKQSRINSQNNRNKTGGNG